MWQGLAVTSRRSLSARALYWLLDSNLKSAVIFFLHNFQIWTRHSHGIRGYCIANIVAFDKHWNMALEDVTEVWTRPKRRKIPALGKFSPIFKRFLFHFPNCRKRCWCACYKTSANSASTNKNHPLRGQKIREMRTTCKAAAPQGRTRSFSCFVQWEITINS